MSSRTIDGVALPLPLAGHPALDFCNTRAGWNADNPKEYLLSLPVLAIWCREAGLISGLQARTARETAESAQAGSGTDGDPVAVLARALDLREAVYRICTGGAAESDWRLVSVEAAAARTASVLVPGPPALWRLSGPSIDLPVLAVAESVVDLLTSPLAGTVGACPGVGCGWLFSDPRHRRRWCSMAVCGNRAKARRYRAAG